MAKIDMASPPVERHSPFAENDKLNGGDMKDKPMYEQETGDRLFKTINEIKERIYAQREEILEAFIAKHGCEPDECEQVTETTLNGMRWFVRKRKR